MSSRSGLKVPGWIPLVGAVAVMSVLVALLWVNLPDAGQTTFNSSAEITAQESIPTPPATGDMPEPTPSVVTPAGTKPAPGFQGIVQWLNSEPLSLKEQRGNVVLIDFWTYS